MGQMRGQAIPLVAGDRLGLEAGLAPGLRLLAVNAKETNGEVLDTVVPACPRNATALFRSAFWVYKGIRA